jgi:hypothetical protein
VFHEGDKVLQKIARHEISKAAIAILFTQYIMSDLTLPFAAKGSSDPCFSITTTNGTAIVAISESERADGHGLTCKSQGGAGLICESDTGVGLVSNSRANTGVQCQSIEGIGARAFGKTGVEGTGSGTNALGKLGCRDPQFGQAAGVYGESPQQGVMGLTLSSGGTGVYGGGTTAAAGGQIGVRGETMTGVGVKGTSFGDGTGVKGESQTRNGVEGITHGTVAAITALNQSGKSDGIGLFSSGGIAGQFFGNVQIKGDLTMLSGGDIRLADFSEDFDISGQEELEPGTVVVLDREGSVQKSQTPYDKKVAGVISGAGDFRPAITLDRQTSQGHRIPIALMGKVYCKVDAQYSAVDVGDLLTTSPTPGHAMKADDPLRALGTLIGKALRRLEAGQGLIPILVALQ